MSDEVERAVEFIEALPRAQAESFDEAIARLNGDPQVTVLMHPNGCLVLTAEWDDGPDAISICIIGPDGAFIDPESDPRYPLTTGDLN